MTEEEYNRLKSVVSPSFPGYTGGAPPRGAIQLTGEEKDGTDGEGRSQYGPEKCEDGCGPDPRPDMEDIDLNQHSSVGSGSPGSPKVRPVVSGGPKHEGGNPYKNVRDEEGKDALAANDAQVGGTHYKEDSALKCPNCGHKIQHWDISWLLKWDFFQYCITKYLFRWRYKNGIIDLQKANHYLQKYIELQKPGGPAGRS